MRALTFVALSVALLIGSGSLRAQNEEDVASMVTAERVKAALLEKGGDKALPIQVTIDRSTAILIGEVETKTVQELAKEVALSVDGVDKVENRLRVAGAKKSSEMSAEEAAARQAAELADAKLESSVKIALYKEIGVKARKIEVEASDGVVSLRGTLPDEARKTVALETVENLSSVKSVVDLIKVEE